MGAQSDMEAIVQEVLRRIAQLAGTAGVLQGPRVENHAANSPEPSELRVPDRLITLALLDGKLDGVRQMVVPTNAVLTPAVRDELRRRNIDWRRATTGSTSDGRKQQRLGLLLVSEDPSISLPLWKQNVKACEIFPATTLSEISDRVAKWVDAQHVAVAWSKRPMRLACRLNKQQTIRAIAAMTETEINRGIDEAGANVLVLDASAVNSSWPAWIERFRATGDRNEPQ